MDRPVAEQIVAETHLDYWNRIAHTRQQTPKKRPMLRYIALSSNVNPEDKSRIYRIQIDLMNIKIPERNSIFPVYNVNNLTF